MTGPAADWRPPGRRDWKCDYGTDGASIHIRPRNDLIWHPATEDCPCGPTPTHLHIDSPVQWLVAHHALDNRESAPPGLYEPAADPTDPPGGDGCVGV